MFISTLYVGYYKQNLYALPSYVYNWQTPLIEGPVLTNIDQLNDEHQIIPFPINEENATSSFPDLADDYNNNEDNQAFNDHQ